MPRCVCLFGWMDVIRFYLGKMCGGDAIFGWFDADTGEGHVESYGMPTYESEDIVAAAKPDRWVWECSSCLGSIALHQFIQP